MIDSTVSRVERRRRRERRQAGYLGLGVLVSSIATTVLLLIVGPDAHAAASHHARPPAQRTAVASRSAPGQPAALSRSVSDSRMAAAVSRAGVR